MNRCKVCGLSFNVPREEDELRGLLTPVVGANRLELPRPTKCPQCRHMTRLLWRNERTLYRTTCALTHKPVISSFSPDKDFKVCDRAAWLTTDNLDFGRDFDFSRPFFDQFAELYSDTYKAAVIQSGQMDNSAYSHFTGWLKNCYLLFDSGKCENCAYCTLSSYSNASFDCTMMVRSELCYECYKIEDCYAVSHATYAKNCSNSAFLFDCIGCKHCIGCVNLRNQEYHLFNEPVPRQEFERIWADLMSGSEPIIRDYEDRFQRLLSRSPRRSAFLVNALNSSGDSLINCENVHESFDVSGGRNLRHCHYMFPSSENCLDVSTFGEGMDYCYEVSACGGASGKAAVSNIFFSAYIYYGGYNILYSVSCHESSSDLFGCADLRRKQHCILNQQYTKSEYEALVPRIVAHMRETGEWGNFFPPSIAPYAYNESLAQEDIPLTPERAETIGVTWSSYIPPIPDVQGIIETSELPSSIHDLDDSILDAVIRCSETGKLFRLIKPELEFYRKQGLPIPRLHPQERNRRRIARRNPLHIESRPCSLCENLIMSAHPQRAPYPVLCENCFTAQLP
ncbi:MAG: hypothetical protein IT290_05240 [Deltaproteobacteria bacterium]|nr:hypothetical protein [Deltaproteobacteria bacterium]